MGNELLKLLLFGEVYSRVTALVRSPLIVNHPKLDEKIVDFDYLAEYRESFAVNDVFCCIGTTIKKAKSKETFKKVDVEYPIELARLSMEKKAEKFLIITSIGADANSLIFYSKIKGLLEEQLKCIGLNSLQLFRPSLLLGDRKEHRFSEDIGAKIFRGLSFLFTGPLSKFAPIEAKTVALAMYKAAQYSVKGVHVYNSDKIKKLVLCRF